MRDGPRPPPVHRGGKRGAGGLGEYRRRRDEPAAGGGLFALSFRITAQSGHADEEIAEQIIIAELGAVGVRLEADNKTGVSFRQARYHGDYDLLYGRWVTAADPVYSVFYGTDGPDNGQGYSDPELDAAMRAMEAAIDPAARRGAAVRMQEILARDLPSIPLLSAVSLAAKSVRLKNYEPNPTNMTDFVACADWYLDPVSPARMASR